MAQAPANGGIGAAYSIGGSSGALDRPHQAWALLARKAQASLKEIVEQNQPPLTSALPRIRKTRNAESYQAFNGQHSYICRALLPLTVLGVLVAGKQVT